MSKIRDEMNEMWQEAQQFYGELRFDPESHIKICWQLADGYDLWQPLGSEGDTEFPLWLSHFVSGAIKEFKARP